MEPWRSLLGLAWVLPLALCVPQLLGGPGAKAATCGPREACRVNVDGFFDMSFCACSQGSQCWTGEAAGLWQDGSLYHFCFPATPRTMPRCSEGQVGLVRQGLRQSVHCACEGEGLELVSGPWDAGSDTTAYRCAERAECGRGRECAVRQTREGGTSNLRRLCHCPEEEACQEDGGPIAETTAHLALHRQPFRCKPQQP